ncbi:zinc-finger domain-containing protein [Coralloluteibacterium stylophorae]|uniref:Zinc-finger domain-containing protein n=1 Tax=Coralloluteibacterium stylophorae TaxID=1776034 RepID=A0A8J7VUP4_9GAMM|nr:zinc-finger domain-containing protein [Coralloluteibacterium stylophorae]MBS7458496.1 zinc-finger domain-containing protein [Coralloluteibacterium stylophorae]
MTHTSSSEPSATAPAATLANAERRYEVTRSDLPLSCPMPGMGLWNSHPRVYLPIETQGGEAKCPYCGALYVLKD